jgi:hypothetical protein
MTFRGFDTISLDHASGLCTMTVVDHLPWDAQHLLDLQARINDCLQYVESGEIYLSHPATRDRAFTIDLRFIYLPDQPACAFLAHAGRILEDAGYTLRFGPLGSCYADDAKDALQ